MRLVDKEGKIGEIDSRKHRESRDDHTSDEEVLYEQEESAPEYLNYIRGRLRERYISIKSESEEKAAELRSELERIDTGVRSGLIAPKQAISEYLDIADEIDLEYRQPKFSVSEEVGTTEQNSPQDPSPEPDTLSGSNQESTEARKDFLDNASTEDTDRQRIAEVRAQIDDTDQDAQENAEMAAPLRLKAQKDRANGREDKAKKAEAQAAVFEEAAGDVRLDEETAQDVSELGTMIDAHAAGKAAEIERADSGATEVSDKATTNKPERRASDQKVTEEMIEEILDKDSDGKKNQEKYSEEIINWVIWLVGRKRKFEEGYSANNAEFNNREINKRIRMRWKYFDYYLYSEPPKGLEKYQQEFVDFIQDRGFERYIPDVGSSFEAIEHPGPNNLSGKTLVPIEGTRVTEERNASGPIKPGGGGLKENGKIVMPALAEPISQEEAEKIKAESALTKVAETPKSDEAEGVKRVPLVDTKIIEIARELDGDLEKIIGDDFSTWNEKEESNPFPEYIESDEIWNQLMELRQKVVEKVTDWLETRKEEIKNELSSALEGLRNTIIADIESGEAPEEAANDWNRIATAYDFYFRIDHYSISAKYNEQLEKIKQVARYHKILRQINQEPSPVLNLPLIEQDNLIYAKIALKRAISRIDGWESSVSIYNKLAETESEESVVEFSDEEINWLQKNVPDAYKLYTDTAKIKESGATGAESRKIAETQKVSAERGSEIEIAGEKIIPGQIWALPYGEVVITKTYPLEYEEHGRDIPSDPEQIFTNAELVYDGKRIGIIHNPKLPEGEDIRKVDIIDEGAKETIEIGQSFEFEDENYVGTLEEILVDKGGHTLLKFVYTAEEKFDSAISKSECFAQFILDGLLLADNSPSKAPELAVGQIFFFYEATDEKIDPDIEIILTRHEITNIEYTEDNKIKSLTSEVEIYSDITELVAKAKQIEDVANGVTAEATKDKSYTVESIQRAPEVDLTEIEQALNKIARLNGDPYEILDETYTKFRQDVNQKPKDTPSWNSAMRTRRLLLEKANAWIEERERENRSSEGEAREVSTSDGQSGGTGSEADIEPAVEEESVMLGDVEIRIGDRWVFERRNIPHTFEIVKIEEDEDSVIIGFKVGSETGTRTNSKEVWEKFFSASNKLGKEGNA